MWFECIKRKVYPLLQLVSELRLTRMSSSAALSFCFCEDLTPLPGPSRGLSSLLAGGLLASALCARLALLPLAVGSAVRLLAGSDCSCCGRFLSFADC